MNSKFNVFILVSLIFFMIDGSNAMNNKCKNINKIILQSTTFTDGQKIPKKHTAEGENKSPGLVINNIPTKTKSLILIVEDPDARPFFNGKTFIHLIAQLEPSNKTITINEGELNGENEKVKKIIANDFNEIKYGGPKPPAGKAHLYIFTVIALNKKIDITENTKEYFRDTWNQESGFFKEHNADIIGCAQITGKYESQSK